MIKANLFCDQPDCGDLAISFGFLRNGNKEKTCATHIQTLASKELMTFPIAAYNFIDSVQDAGLYNDRKRLIEKGLAAVNTLKSKCDEDWAAGQTRISTVASDLQKVVRKTFEEMLGKGQERYEETKRKLDATRSRFEQFVLNKSVHLSAEDRKLCETVPTWSPFRVILGDCRVTVADTLRSHFYILTKDSLGELKTVIRDQFRAEKVDIVTEMKRYMKEHGYPSSPYPDPVQTPSISFSLSRTRQEITDFQPYSPPIEDTAGMEPTICEVDSQVVYCKHCGDNRIERMCDEGHQLCAKCCRKPTLLGFGRKEYCPMCELGRKEYQGWVGF